ncbi:hypothetical protein [Runella sp.]|uniref:hypothetical protein n=1 Tax=Runella sp. TaxID=1960881 RepID=UPI00301A86F8
MQKQLLSFSVFFWGVLYQVYCQEAIYLNNGNSFPFKLTEATEEVVKYSELKGDRVLKRSFRRENVLIAFNAAGGYLIIAGLSLDPQQANQQITDLYNKPRDNYDILVKSNPFKVIVGNISYASDEIINYKTSQGISGSVNKNELAAIIYRDGRHELSMPITEAVPLLEKATPEIERLKNEPVSTPLPVQNEVAAAAPVSETPKTTPAKSNRQKPVLDESELLSYREKSLRRVDEFVQYLNIITDKTLETDEKDKAIDQAAKLFLPDADIQVTSVNWSGIKTYPIKEYLKRLKLLPYNSTKIEWHEVNYVSELTQAGDGNYYGMISGTQTFTGYGTNNDDILYSDVTRKNVKVKLQSYQKSVEGQQQLNWEVLLGNIGVAVDK